VLLLWARKLSTLSRNRSSWRRFACLPGNAWENGYIKSFNARFRDGLLNAVIIYTMKET